MEASEKDKQKKSFSIWRLTYFNILSRKRVQSCSPCALLIWLSISIWNRVDMHDIWDFIEYDGCCKRSFKKVSVSNKCLNHFKATYRAVQNLKVAAVCSKTALQIFTINLVYPII